VQDPMVRYAKKKNLSIFLFAIEVIVLSDFLMDERSQDFGD